ncbi:hypothetical protein [Lactiplantibacillus plantarum]
MGIVRSISFLGIVCIVYLLSLFANLKSPDWNGWLGFLGSMFGSIVAIGGVYWQVNRTIKNDKELVFSQSRPFFIVKLELVLTDFNMRYYYQRFERDGVEQRVQERLKSMRSSQDEIPVLTINNVSEKTMMAVQIELELKNESREIYKVNRIGVNQKISILTQKIKNELDSDDGDIYSLKERLSEIINDVKFVNVCYTTEVREQIKLVFAFNNSSLEYLPQKKQIENHGDKLSKEEYDSSGFEESPYQILLED